MAPKRVRGKTMEEMLPPSPVRARRGRLPQYNSFRGSQPCTSSQIQHSAAVRPTRSQLETQQNQSVSSPDENLTAMHDETGEIESEVVRTGRGPAKSIPEWGTGKKLHLIFDSNWKPIRENASKFTTQLGVMFLHSKRVAEGKKTDRLSMFMATRAKKTKNDDLEVYDEESSVVIDQFNELLEEREQEEQNEAFREEVFTRVMGPDGHGRVRMYGTGVTPSQVFGQSSRASGGEEIEREYQIQINALQAKHQAEIQVLQSQLQLVTAHLGLQYNNLNESGSGQACEEH